MAEKVTVQNQFLIIISCIAPALVGPCGCPATSVFDHCYIIEITQHESLLYNIRCGLMMRRFKNIILAYYGPQSLLH